DATHIVAFFFSSRRRHTRCYRDWSSDVCSSDLSVHRLLIDAQQASDQAARVKLYMQAQELIHRDAPWVPLVHAARVGAYRNQVENFLLHPLQIWWLHRVWIK